MSVEKNLSLSAYANALGMLLRRDFWLYCFIGLYTAVAAVLSIESGRGVISPGTYLHNWMFVPVAAAIAHIAGVAVTFYRSRHSRPVGARRVNQIFAPPVIAGTITYLSLGIFHGSFTAVKTALPEFWSFYCDSQLADIDAILHGVDAWKIIPSFHILTRTLQFFYYPVWILLLSLTSFYISVFADVELRTVYLKTFVFCWVGLGNILAAIFMSAGPIFFQEMTGSSRYSSLIDYLDFSRGLAYSSVDVASYLWTLYANGLGGKGSGISAFPSLHVAMATLWVIGFWNVLPGLRFAMIAYLALIQIGSIHLGWHYGIDGYVSAVVTAAAWRVFRQLDRRKSVTAVAHA